MKAIVFTYVAVFLFGLTTLDAQETNKTSRDAFTGTQFSTNKVGVVDALMTQKLLAQKPAIFSNLSHRLDYIQENLTYDLQNRVYSLDTMFAPGAESSIPAEEIPRSRFRLGLYVELEAEEDFKASFSPDFTADVELPNMEREWRIFITTSADDELPGRQITEQENDAQLGISRLWEQLNIRTSTGVKMRVPPELFVKAVWARDYKMGKWLAVPYEKLFWESDEGFGNLTSLNMERWFHMFEREWVFRSTSAGLITEKSEGWQIEQTIALARFKQWISGEQSKRLANKHAAARGWGVFYSVFGHMDEEDVLDKHRVGFVYRRPVYKNWLFMEISPQLEWENDNGWEEEPILRFGFDALFWGAETY